MATPQEHLAHALQALKTLQDEGVVAIRSKDLDRPHRERLTRAGFLKPIIKGWYIPSRPEESGEAETTAWYASFWDFSAAYLTHRFDEEWSLSPEQSLLLHVGNRTVPPQLLVRSPRARNKVTNLVHGTSILEVRAKTAAREALQEVEGMRTFKLPNALVKAGRKFFTSHPVDAQAALAAIRDASELLAILLEGGHSTIAGRIAGAFQNIGRDALAQDILKAMRAAGYTVSQTNPFEDELTTTLPARQTSPYVVRLHATWQSMRDDIIASFPRPPGIPSDANEYLKTVDDIYPTDAYHSLSIEGYRVDDAIIERVRAGSWNPDDDESDRRHRDAMAARGYWLAFNEVKRSVQRILEGENAGTVAEEDHGDWYRALFRPSVEARILGVGDLAGYRSDQVFIRNSMHVPPRREAVLDCMPALFDQLREEPHAAVRSVLGHWLFVYIHPYMDGNGRIGRFLMNAMLASGGYPWTVIPVEKRTPYMQALEEASTRENITPFAVFLGELVVAASSR